MKSSGFLTVLFIVSLHGALTAQTAINTDGSPPHASAMLDVKSDKAGVLIPRLSQEERDMMPSRTQGLIIFNTTSERLNYWNGSNWNEVAASFLTTTTGSLAFDEGVAINLKGERAEESAMLDVSSSEKGILIPRTKREFIENPATGLLFYCVNSDRLSFYDGAGWQAACQDAISSVITAGTTQPGGIAINLTDEPPHPSAVLDVSSGNHGILIPRLTDTERNQINPAVGLIIYNTSSHTLQFYTRSGWFSIMNLPPAPVSGTHSAAGQQITWRWNDIALPQPMGYKYNTVNDYQTATDNGTNSHYVQNGLECLEIHSLFVWAYNSCGYSEVTELTKELFCCPLSPTVTDIDGNVYNTTQIGDQCWMAESLKVTRTATGENITRLCYSNSSTNCDNYGGLYSWITVMNGSPTSNTSPSGVQGICPDGWHIPSHAEWDVLANNVSGGNTVKGNRLKSCRQVDSPEGGFCATTTHPRWNSHSTHYGTDDYGFNGLPGGYRAASAFYGLGEYTYFQTASEFSSSHTIFRQLRFNFGDIFGGTFTGMDKTASLSLRCVRTCSETPQQPSTINGPTNPAANSNELPYSVQNQSGVTFNWSVPEGWSIESGQGTNQISVNAGTSSGLITVTANNACGNSPASSLNVAIWTECGDDLSFKYGEEWVTYGTVNGQYGTCWFDRNLGASRVATAFNDVQSYGNLYQWGRLTDGHQLRSSELTNTQSNSDIPGHGDFIHGGIDWRSPKNDNLWQGENGINNPCPSGWRIPTELEWETEKSVFLSNNLLGAYSSALKLPAAGYRHHGAGTISGSGSQCQYWSSAIAGDNARLLRVLDSDGANMATHPRGEGSSVRCIKDCMSPPEQPNTINGPENPCQNTPGISYSVMELMLTNYTWQVPEGWEITSGQGSNGIIVTTGSASGSINVTAYNSCGNSEPQTMVVAPTPGVPAQPSEITGNSSPCPQTLEIYSIEPVPGAISYQWTVEGQIGLWFIQNGNGSNSITVHTDLGSADISVVAVNSCGQSQEQSITPISYLPPAITVHPNDVSMCTGYTTEFVVHAGGAGPLTYQWQVNTGSGWVNITGNMTQPTYTGFNSNTLFLENDIMPYNNGYQYRCIVSGYCAPPATSNVATLTVYPHITQQPLNSLVCENGSAHFSITGAGQSMVSYQWQLDSGTGWVNITTGGSNPTYFGYQTNTLEITNIPSSINGYQYRCVVHDPGCNRYDAISSAATLGVISPPTAPTQGSHTTGPDYITWRWNAVSGASGYRFNTTNDYNSATDNGTSTSFNQTGLNCCQTYNLYVWAYSNCGNSPATMLTSGTFQPVTIETVNTTGLCVGNNTAVTFTITNPEPGVMYQWRDTKIQTSWVNGIGANGVDFPGSGSYCCGDNSGLIIYVRGIRSGVTSSETGSYNCSGSLW